MQRCLVLIAVTASLSVAAARLCAATYHEAPMLAEMVARGELAPVDQRLPDEPVVVEPVAGIGRYGGTWRRVAMGRFDIGMTSRLGYEPLVRWDRSGKKVAPGLAEAWEINDGGKTFVFHLRKGVKWSDGQPFTSEDVRFYYEDILLNKELTPVWPGWLKIDNLPVIIDAPDPHTVAFRFASPYGVFLEEMAYRGTWVIRPAHYLRRYHPKYTAPEDLKEEIERKGLDHWYQLFWQKSDANENPELPTLNPWQVKVPLPATRVIVERNPYYWKVDPAGNQLPYIDRLAFTMVQNTELVNLKAMTGDVDFQARSIDSANYPLFMENRVKSGYRVMKDYNATPTVIYVNPHSKNERIRGILSNRKFRIALSLAINRDELIDLIYSGMATKTSGIVSPFDPYYLPEWDETYTRFDPETSRRLLDEVGLRAGSDGMRRLPDGGPFRQTLNCYPSELGVTADLWQLVVDYWREVGLDFTVKVDARALSNMQMANGNTDFWAYAIAGMHWVVDPVWYVPWTTTSYFAPLYGRYQANPNDKLGIRPPPEYQRLIDWYLELRSIVNDGGRRLELGRKILGQWAQQCYVIGIVRQQLVTIVSNTFKNVPKEIIHDYRVLTPAYIGIEQFYIDQE